MHRQHCSSLTLFLLFSFFVFGKLDGQDIAGSYVYKPNNPVCTCQGFPENHFPDSFVLYPNGTWYATEYAQIIVQVADKKADTSHFTHMTKGHWRFELTPDNYKNLYMESDSVFTFVVPYFIESDFTLLKFRIDSLTTEQLCGYEKFCPCEGEQCVKKVTDLFLLEKWNQAIKQYAEIGKQKWLEEHPEPIPLQAVNNRHHEKTIRLTGDFLTAELKNKRSCTFQVGQMNDSCFIAIFLFGSPEKIYWKDVATFYKEITLKKRIYLTIPGKVPSKREWTLTPIPVAHN